MNEHMYRGGEGELKQANGSAKKVHKENNGERAHTNVVSFNSKMPMSVFQMLQRRNER